ncbi:D-isomer specific 2-hydroxyacid dehydrogenase family protein [Oenococcus oeni]|mgnify:CR=1 FL=1|uniref:D-isomer specific 2-hydroxyacid dehydrogenase family protein n=1 Tax=Oenococcus oeni TaxID=1247 RepID=UPI0008F84C16|nr:D-isomer specific 2-hydroxyacid dehydrogenase family protein [Oenococcus oeni]OIK85856.1 hydroxyacid dehydrogenase [Oenococcus oeni]OIL08068.1 hydroxyacid dehydrogenase [Oenococcus oeni]OIL11310.1 hydroxyacid dehydrogenase [Oenococcus oeni]SYW12226.1 2-hydroxyacid dehydrogenase [Oenococcus oeni]SYW15688.1 2-hydroxyacid dehydrogenase [Oenococcus oeni]
MTEKYRIAIVNSNSFGKVYTQHIERLKKIGSIERFMFDQQISGKELAEKLQGFNIIIASVTPNFTKEFFDNKDELLLLSRHGIGFNNVDLQAAKNHGTLVTLVPEDIERDAVAENALANLMSVVRRIIPSYAANKAGNWETRADFQGTNLTGKTFGVIGCGNIGSRMAEIFNQGFHGRVLITDPNPEPHAPKNWFKDNHPERVGLETLLESSDFITLNASLNETSRGILGEQALNRVKRGVYITNAARGALIDENAMLEAIEDRRVRGYATDTTIEEPTSANHPFFKNDRVIVTPHTSAYTDDCLFGMGEKCVSDVENFVNHKPLVREITAALALA